MDDKLVCWLDVDIFEAKMKTKSASLGLNWIVNWL